MCGVATTVRRRVVDWSYVGPYNIKCSCSAHYDNRKRRFLKITGDARKVSLVMLVGYSLVLCLADIYTT